MATKFTPMEEVEPLYVEHDPRSTGRIYLAVLAVITPAAFFAVHAWWDRDGKVPIAFPYLCLGVVFFVMFCIAMTMATCKGRVRWIIADGEIVYESPTSIFGESFRMPLSEFRRVDYDGDSNIAFCESRTGVRYTFDTHRPGGSAVYQRLKQEQKRLERAGEEGR